MNTRIIVYQVTNTLYYDIQLQKANGPYWENHGGTVRVHENQLSASIPVVLRSAS